MAEQEQNAARKGREGGRWINERPTSEEFALWFRESMKIDPALNVEDYIGGVVLIPAVDTKAKYVQSFRDGAPVLGTREELSYVPYAKVETRIAYFWDYLEAHEEDRVGVVERITPARMPIDFVHTSEDLSDGVGESGQPHYRRLKREIRTPSALTQMEHRLPEGFSLFTVPVGEKYSHFLLCTIRVAIYRRADWEQHGSKALPLRAGQGSKQVPLSKSNFQGDRVWADDSVLMKCETGALGRALGFAGVFVIPGSGIATAEDMLEALAQGQTPTASEPDSASGGPQTPSEPPVKTGAEQVQDEQAALSKRAATLYKALQEDHPEAAEKFGEWAHKRRITKLSDAKGAMLRGIVSQLEKLSAAAEERSQQAPPEKEAPDVPSEESEETDGEPSGQAG